MKEGGASYVKKAFWAGGRGLLAFLLVFSPAMTVAAEGDAGSSLPQLDMGMASLKMFAALLFVVGIIVALFYLSKKLRAKGLSLHRYPAMRMMGSLSLAPKRSIAVVEVCGEWLVLGVGTETITLLSKFEEPPAPESMPALETGVYGSFQSLLRRKIGRSPSGKLDRSEKNETSR